MSLLSTDPLLELLKGVSRSFYLSVAFLPAAVRQQIVVAYLLARASDTIADVDSLPAASRLELLHQFRHGLNTGAGQLELREIATSSGSEGALLRRLDEVLARLRSFDSDDQGLIREVLEIITSGQSFDLTRFADANADNIVALETEAELDDYTFRVAGCVGLFWTKLCRRHLFPHAPLDQEALLREGVEFGKGLQLVNILRDLPADLRNGRCYIPKSSLSSVNLQPSELQLKENEPRFRPLYSRLLASAESKLESARRYTDRLPYTQFRLRFACQPPILIGQETLRRLAHANVLDATQRVKVSRSEVRVILFRSAVSCLLPGNA